MLEFIAIFMTAIVLITASINLYFEKDLGKKLMLILISNFLISGNYAFYIYFKYNSKGFDDFVTNRPEIIGYISMSALALYITNITISNIKSRVIN